MLTITVLGKDYWDSEKNEFLYPESFTIELEHSLVALSKWESIYARPFLGKQKMTDEEILTYISCMILTPGYGPEAVHKLSPQNLEEINTYMNLPASATWFTDKDENKTSSEVVTSELIYYWMSAFHIPFEAETWHLKRLFTLLKVAGIKNSPEKKMSPQERIAQQRRLNDERRARMGSKG